MADTIERLKELKEMLDGGLITQAEFDELKAKELGTDTSVGNGFDKGQQMDFSSVNQNFGSGNNNGKKRGKGCLTALLVFVSVIVLIIVGVLAADAGYDRKDRIEQERIDALEQIVDVNQYYHMTEEEVIELHGEPDEVHVVTENAKSFDYYNEGFATAFQYGICDIYIYKKSFDVEKIEDVFVLFGIVPNGKNIEMVWMDNLNEYSVDSINDKVDGAFIKINESEEKKVDEFSVFFK